MKHLAKLAIGSLLLFPPAGKAHQTVENVPFPAECCSDRDCEKVTSDQITKLPNGDWIVKMPRGEVRVPWDFPRKQFPSPDLFVCVTFGTYPTAAILRCVLASPSV